MKWEKKIKGSKKMEHNRWKVLVPKALISKEWGNEYQLREFEQKDICKIS